MKRKGFLILLIAVMGFSIKAQDTLLLSAHPFPLWGIINNGDTALLSAIDEAYIFPERKFKNKRDLRRYRKLIRNIKRVYPYAKIAGQKFKEVDATMATLKTEKQQKEYINRVEAEIKSQYEDELKKLTITQGRILIKLIDRETGRTSYEVVRELQGNFKAFLWQALARLFGSNLKWVFDGQGEDKLINEIVIMIERGVL
ncbi:MAG: DUF4294 domain-containing protein [Bacteroidales bacterium]|nr:DUF4294 domain-containing protein [Bacteroidales bacterium]MBN2762729.1 DUF4294 domain-containing protein [Bacteroidales bacterium]